MINVLIVDDETLARENIKSLLKNQSDIKNIFEAENGTQALTIAELQQVDIIFLDIQMPGQSGIELAEKLPSKSVIIFATAYNQHAITAFDLNAIDYLLKPFNDERFYNALHRARKELLNQGTTDFKEISELIQQMKTQQDSSYKTRLVIKDPGRIRLIDVEQIKFISGAGNYAEIHLFDGDEYCQHNAFRSPGSTSIDELRDGKFKVEHHKERYEKMRNGIHAHACYLDEQNLNLLDGFDFVFISIDSGSVKEGIFAFLKSKGIPFVDVGIGVQLVDDKLTGIIRTTLCTPDKFDHLPKVISIADAEEGDYSTNIQIAELNGLNAALAVLKWKKLFGFYHDHNGEYHSTYTLNAHMLLGDEDDDAA